MTSQPPDENILYSPFSASPPSLRGNSPLRRRDSTNSVDDPNRPSRQSPVLPRSFDPNDPEVRERQRAMDVDMAMQLQRARRETISLPPPALPYETDVQQEDHQVISPLSIQEQHELHLAKGESPHGDEYFDHDGGALPSHLPALPFDLVGDPSPRHDPLVSLGSPRIHADPEDPSSAVFGLPRYQATATRSVFLFSVMEQFAADERTRLGITFPSQRPQTRPHSVGITSSTGPPTDVVSELSTSPLRTTPSRKFSQSVPGPRAYRKGIGGKLALFEGNMGSPSPHLARLGAHGHASQLMGDAATSSSGPHISVSGGGVIPGMGILHSGHDRPYRFSFYSNSLPAAIHARSLSELPADGQSFLDLFTGVNHDEAVTTDTKPEPPLGRPSNTAVPTANVMTTGAEKPRRSAMYDGGSGFSQPRNSNVDRNSKNGAVDYSRNGFNAGVAGAGDDFEASTWWLDVLCPTDDEMKMLSQVFSIHPLTTEDIQMEETREKIELFRNYYFVCFRSFDQDPHSPTHLEPLNMYIIVFREGTLSFHFRPTPHPQNVRRRIKQLKDYISVTSDWISYALIDDITDAFGPLIQSIEYEVDTIDELVLIIKGAEQSDMLRRIGTCRKKVMGLLRLMGNKADVVKGLAKRCNENWKVAPTSDIGLYLSDIQDHLITMTQNLNHYEKILSRSHSNYLAQISIEMTDANNQINDVLSKLTALGTVLIPMNLVTGLWGMNVHVPGQNVESYTWFVSIIAALAAFAVIGGYSTYRFMVKRST